MNGNDLPNLAANFINRDGKPFKNMHSGCVIIHSRLLCQEFLNTIGVAGCLVRWKCWRILETRKAQAVFYYDELRDRNLKKEAKVLQHLLMSQQHTATNHMRSTSAIIDKLFRATPQPQEARVNYVKKDVFGVEDGGPILPADHPVYTRH